jgi:hypothetical protein
VLRLRHLELRKLRHSHKLRCSVVDHMMRRLTVSDKFEVLFHDQNKHKILDECDRCDTKT